MSDLFFRQQVNDPAGHGRGFQRVPFRIKSEAPLESQIQPASPNDFGHQRRLRALQGLAPEARHLQDILDNFQPPENPLAREVKQEPIEERQLHRSTLEMAARISARVSKSERINQPTPIRNRPVVDLTSIDDLIDDTTHEERMIQRRTRDAFDRDEPSRLPTSTLSNHATTRPKAKLPPLTHEQVEVMDQLQVPHGHLSEIRSAYQRSREQLPPHITTWSALKIFAVQHPIPLLSPDNIRHAQTELYHKTTPLSRRLSSVGRTNSVPQNLILDDVQQPRRVATLPQLKIEEPDEIETINDPDDRVQRRSTSQHQRLRTSQRTPQHNTSNIAPPLIDLDPPTSIPTDISTTMPASTVPVLSDLQIQRLVEPLNICPELLPPDAPENHPHLVQVWDPALVALSREKHDHLNLIDTIVSIIYKYDESTRDPLKAFLDVDKIKHFFFLFKSRTNKYHSWSVEREGNFVTIGIERNERAQNVAIESPSAGHNDVTLRYQLQSYSSLLPDANNDTPEDSPLARWTSTGRSTFPSKPSLSTFLYETPPNRGADNHERFDHSLPFTRSASDVRNTLQPDQRPNDQQIPSDRLSILARYFQTTAFTALAMEAEFQVCWGHKVRYDAGLGRVRAAFTNALRGAITQAKRREAGEYNRHVSGDVRSTNGGGEKPGSGSTLGHLRGDGANGRKRKRGNKGKQADEESSASEYVESD